MSYNGEILGWHSYDRRDRHSYPNQTAPAQLPADLVARPILLAWLSQHRRRPLTLVSAGAGYGKTTLLSELLHHPPRAMHLVITTRSDPPLPIYKLRARAQVTEIRPHELRFKAAETTTFLQQLGIQTDEITAASLTQKTEGWVTGLRLATLSLRHRGDIELLMKGMPENSHYVTDYLLAEVLNRLEPAIQDFLLKSSILDRLCGPLCDAVTGLDEPECHRQAYLAWLLDQNLFTIPLDDQSRQGDHGAFP